MRSIGPSGGSTTYLSEFSPVLGGVYSQTNNIGENTRGDWYGSETSTTASRYYLSYDNGTMNTYVRGDRYSGRYIRCINKQKTVLDLTYILGIDARD